MKPILKAWDRFHAAASEAVTLFYPLRDGELQFAEHWHTFREAIQRALGSVNALSESD